MDNSFVQRHFFDGVISLEPNEAGGETVTLGGSDTFTEDYPGLALASAEGFFDLISNNCDYHTFEPVHGNLETIASLAALASELYLKSILMKELGLSPKEIRDKFRTKGHDLRVLYNALSAESKHALVESIDGAVTEADLESLIDPIKNVFKDYRYDYELSSGLELSYGFLFELLMRLRDLAHSLVAEDRRVIYIYGTHCGE